MLNPQQIKKALIKLAEFKQRPPYEPIVVRTVIANFEIHPLREAILYFCEQDPSEQVARYDELKKLCCSHEVREHAERLTGLDIQSLHREETLITNAAWFKLLHKWDEIEAYAFELSEKKKKKKFRKWVKLHQMELCL